MDYDGTYYTTFQLHAQGGDTAQGQIYKDGSPVGTLRTNGSSSYQTFTETINGVSAGQKLQVYIRMEGSSDTAYIRNFQIGAYLHILGSGNVLQN